LLRSLNECRTNPDTDTGAVCYRPTTFNWSDQDGASYAFATADTLSTVGETRDLVSSRLGDVDGDGRADLVWFRSAGPSHPTCTNKNYTQVSFGDRQEVGGVSKLIVTTPAQATYCSALTASNGELDTAWGLMDYDGDGRDDLIVADDNSVAGARWHVYRSLGRPAAGAEVFDTANDLINVAISTADDSQEQAQLGDFNGDGMLDFLYPTSSTGLAIRFLQRKADGTGFEFSGAYTLQVPTTGCGTSCNVNLFNLGVAAFGVAPDLNGDGRSDIVLRVQQNVAIAGSPMSNLPEQTFYAPEVQRQLVADNVLGFGPPQFYAFIMEARTSTTQSVVQYGAGPLYSYTGGTGPTDARQFQFADFNGDALPDLLYQQELDGDDFVYALNRGNGFQTANSFAFSGQILNVPNREHLRLADINGDGRVDILFPSSTSAPCPGSSSAQRVFRYRTFDFSHGGNTGSFGAVGSSSDTAATCLAGNTVVADDPSQWDYFFADFDGDGASDFVKLRDDGATAFIYTSRGATTSRFKAKDVITRITNGHGAITQIFYQPLTNKAIYRREQNSRLDPAPDGTGRDPDGDIDSWGRGSPVLDVIGAQYVVSAVASSAPTRADPSNQSAIGYRYTGAKVQAGGRGMLGFANITTFDAAPVDGGWTATDQYYRQDFPFVGAPLQTDKWLMTGAITRGSAALDACASDPEALGYDCFYDPAATGDAEHPPFGGSGLPGSRVRVSASLWGCKANGTAEACDYPSSSPPDYCPSLGEAQAAAGATPASLVAPASFLSLPALTRAAGALGAQQPLFPYAPRTLDLDFDPANGAITRHVCGLFQYGDGYGNATVSSVQTYAGASLSTHVATKATTSLYVNDTVNWRLGRLMSSAIDDTRGGVTRSRVTDFDYEVDRAGYSSTTDTGLLKAERLQKDVGDDQDLRTLYTLDDYGNQTYVFQCSRKKADGTTMTDADCRNVNLVQQRPVGAAGPTTAVHRYTRHAYGSNGRYVTASFVPYYAPTAPRHVNEQPSMTISARDEFGNATSVTDANGLVTVSAFGSLNRAYYVGDSTGKSTTTTYRWCGAGTNEASCPGGSSFRQTTVAAGAPTVFVYFDVLGRPTLKVSQSFNQGVSGRNWTAVCTAYDNHGRANFASVPFFLAALYGTSAEPVFTGGGDPCGALASATTTTYDVLGRVRLVTAPDGSTATRAFAGLTTTTTDSRGRQASETKNALGEIVSMVQADATTGALVGDTLTVTQTYDEQGNLRFVQRNAGNGVITSEVQYDALGRKTRVIDPDRGTTTYEYNAAGEVIRTTNALGTRIEQDFDALGRVWRRVAGAAGAFGVPTDLVFRDGFEDGGATGGLLGTDEWQFDTAADGLGALDFERRTFSMTPGTAFFRSYRYDSIGRMIQRQTSFDAATYTESTTFDGFGRVLTQTDASGDTSTTAYTDRGYVSHVTYSRPEVGAAGTFYEIQAQDAWGNVTQERRNGTIATVKSFDPRRGWIDTLSTGNGSLQNWNFDFDTNGNLTRRDRGGGALVEALTYDKLNRLTQVALSGSATTPLSTGVTYDKLGNLCTRGSLSYTYQGADGCNATSLTGRPHAVSQVGPFTYAYDALGNRTIANSTHDPDDHTIEYDAFEQVIFMSRGALTAAVPAFHAEIAYGPDQARYRRLDSQNGSLVKTTRYVGNVEIILSGGVTQTKRYLAGGAIVTTYSNQPGVVEDRYALSDHLGSVDVVVNDTGGVVESASFDAWGQRRGTGNWQGAGASLATTTRGFTGHEHFDAIGLVHMNGRVYDPAIGRFVQSDPLVDAGIQGLNRYSYVLNNPLSFTDPTGHLTWGEWMRIGIGIAVTVATAGAAGGTLNGVYLTAGQKAFVVGAGGALVGAANSQSLKGAAWGAVSALAFYRIGSYFESASWAHNGKHVFGTNLDAGGYAAKVLAHGVAGGALQHLQGGRFGSGFAAAGITQAFSGGIDNIDPANLEGFSVQRVVAAAMLGGVVSDLTGGKFAHGALTSAFAYAFSSAAASNDCGSCDASGSPAGADWSMRNANPDWQDKLSTVVENGVTVIRGELTVSGSGSAYAASDVNVHWYGATGSYQGVSYRSEIKLVPVARGGDWQMRTMSRKDWLNLSRRAGGTVGGQNRIGESIMRMTPDNSYWRQAAVPAHEFGHGLGLSHAPRGSGSIMSYDPVRAVGGRDLYNVASGYR
jgi:RHS repeat-associated protein